MKKLLLILSMILILPIQIAHASSVSICDLNVEDLISRCNQILLANGFQPITFDSIENRDENQLYIYNHGNSRAVFVVNSRDKIEQALISFQVASDESSNSGFESAESILRAIELTEDERNTLFEGDNPISVWSSVLNRRIVIEGAQDDAGIGYISITAEDQ